jgi:hypothetical protein
LSKAGLKAVPLFLCLFWPARKTKKEKSPLARRKEEEASGDLALITKNKNSLLKRRVRFSSFLGRGGSLSSLLRQVFFL